MLSLLSTSHSRRFLCVKKRKGVLAKHRSCAAHIYRDMDDSVLLRGRCRQEYLGTYGRKGLPVCGCRCGVLVVPVGENSPPRCL